METTTTTPTKRGRGRPAGATSFVNVSVADLSRLVNDAPVPVSRVWLTKMGLTIERIAPTVSEAAAETPKVEYKLTRLWF